MTFAHIVLIGALTAQPSAADSVLTGSGERPEAELVAEAREQPLVVREAVSDALSRDELAIAGRLAAAYAVAWRDSFLVREVERFASWPAERRAAKLAADSVRRAGIAAYSRDGAQAAIAIWRRALARSLAVGDTVGVAAVLGNIGAGFLNDGVLDSAATYLARAAALAAAVGDVRVEANAVAALGDVSAARGELADARAQYERALTLRERIGDTRGLAASHNNLGLLAWDTGDLREARRQFQAALTINRRDGRDVVAATNLLNLAGLASLEGEFALAEGLYRDALATWRADEAWADVADALHGLGQLELRRGNYVAARTTLTEALAIYDRTGPPASALRVRQALAGALAAQGDLQGALDELRRAQTLADSTGTSELQAGVALARADLSVRLNALAEAERLYSQAERLYRDAGNPDGEAEAHHGSGLLFLERDDYDRADALLEAALRVQRGSGNHRAAALTRLALGQVARARGDRAAADGHLREAAAELARLGDPVSLAAVLAEQAELQAEKGLPQAAEALYREALAGLNGRAASDVAWRIHAGLAHVLRAQGASDDAARALRVAIADIERSGRSLAVAERRAGFFADKWDVYAQLALLERNRGRPAAAFEASERLRAREMLELLAHGRVATASEPAQVGELIGREQDMRRRIAELSREFEAAAAAAEGLRGPDVWLATGAQREALLTAQERYAELLLEIRDQAPLHADLVAPGVAGWRDVARRLAPDEAFVKYMVSDSGSVAFVIGDSMAVVDLGIVRRDLARLVAFARGTVESPRPGTDELWRGPFQRLYRHLIAPLDETGLLAGKTRLIIVPHTELHYLPFGALLDGARGRTLVERYELMVTPSASVWLALGERPRQHVGVGMLAVAPKPDALPGSRREVAALERLVAAEAVVLIGDRATEEAFRREAPLRRVLHLATYGVLNKHNPLFSFVELAPGAAYDGRLEVHEVFGLDLAADLVVLSACQTGLSSGRLADVPAGDDWVGLTRAFLHAGAANVVATLWAVEDQGTALLMERFYDALAAGGDPVRALAEAQRSFATARATAHPFYWAGFVAVGGTTDSRWRRTP